MLCGAGSADFSPQVIAFRKLWNSGRLAVRSAAAIGRAAGAGSRFVHDLADGKGATAALGAATEAAIDFGGGVRRRRLHDRPYIVVAQDVAGTHDHRSLKTPAVGHSK